MNKIRASAYKYPVIFSIIIIIFSALMTEIPLTGFFARYMDLRKAHFLVIILEQGICAAILTLFIKALGIIKTAGFTKPKEWKHVWLGWPLAVMGLLNGIEVLSGEFVFNTSEPTVFVLYVLAIISVGFIEEIMARGLVLNLMLQKWGHTKRGIYLATIISSSLFGLSHLTTVMAGRRELVAGIIQAVSTTFFGVIFAACFLRNNSVWPIIILHAFVDLFAKAYDLTPRFGEIRTTTVQGAVITLVVTIPLLIYGLFIIRKVKPFEQLPLKIAVGSNKI